MIFKNHIGKQFLIQINAQTLWVSEDCFEQGNPLAGYSEFGKELKRLLAKVFNQKTSNEDVKRAYFEWMAPNRNEVEEETKA